MTLALSCPLPYIDKWFLGLSVVGVSLGDFFKKGWPIGVFGGAHEATIRALVWKDVLSVCPFAEDLGRWSCCLFYC